MTSFANGAARATSGWVALRILGVVTTVSCGGYVTAAQSPEDMPSAVPVELSNDDLFQLPLNETLTAGIVAATAKLRSPLYADREAASRKLVEIGASAFRHLREAYRRTHDIEVRMRIEDIVQTAFYNYQVFDGNGFLGVTMQPYPNPRLPKDSLPEGRVGVYIANVLEDTAAARAGIVKEDIIVGIDGTPFEGTGNEVLDQLSAAIRSYRPGSSVELTLSRQGEEITIPVILGRCPETQARAGKVRGTSELYRKAEARFPSWWAENFKTEASRNEESAPR